ncbi:hypothetical protein KKC32_01840 [Patescibacteria group bacterium]|nr:hypothetical protein [Patescibacteria group bacterium]
MEHTNRQSEHEFEYAAENERYLLEKRAKVESSADERSERKEKQKSKAQTYCCLFVFFIFIFSVAVIYYFVINIKDDVYNDFLEKKNLLEQNLPPAKAELEKSLEQGQTLYDEAEKSVNEVQSDIDKAKEIYETGKEVYDKVNKIKNAP